MQHATQAYKSVSGQIASPRELEADLLLKSASRLQAVHDTWPSKTHDLDAALLYNRKIWVLFLTSVTSPDSPLPAAIRQNVANLGLFVMKQTVAITMNPRPEQLSSLIRINCDVAAGLQGRAA